MCARRVSWKKKAGIVTLDINSAFDEVLQNRLIYRIRSQDWPARLKRRVEPFISGRFEHIWLDHVTKHFLHILCSLSQGPPISPTLLLVYVKPQLRLSRGKFGYTSDVTIFFSGFSLENCQTKLQKRHDASFNWPKENVDAFDIEKTELMTFIIRGSLLSTVLLIWWSVMGFIRITQRYRF